MSDETKGTEPMTEDELAAIDARVSKATKGPWRAGVVDTDRVFVPYAQALEGTNGERVILRMNAHFPFEDDAAFIASAREDVPRLVADDRRLRAALTSIALFASAIRSAEDATTLYDIAITMAKEADAALG